MSAIRQRLGARAAEMELSQSAVRLQLYFVFLFKVEMGPFKHTVDDGLDVRKAAFECMYTLLESCLDRLDIYEYLNHVEDGLKDHYDIRVGRGFARTAGGQQRK